MTIIFAAALPGVFVQVSDRLLTKKRNVNSTVRRPHDHTSNKSVIYCGKHCKLILGYTGSAYVGKMPTDLWMTQQLWGSGFQDLAGFSFRQPGLLHNANEVVQIFAEAADMPSDVSISIGGYQKTRRGDVPRLWIVRRGRVDLSLDDVRLDRGAFLMNGVEIPPDWSQHSERIELLTTLKRSGGDWKTSRAALVHYVQQIARHADGVGADVLVVAVDKNDRFFSTSLHLADGSRVEAGITYIPSAIFPGVLIPPARILDSRLSLTIGPGYIKSPPGSTQNRHEFVYVQNLTGVPSMNAQWFDHTRPTPPSRW